MGFIARRFNPWLPRPALKGVSNSFHSSLHRPSTTWLRYELPVHRKSTVLLSVKIAPQAVITDRSLVLESIGKLARPYMFQPLVQSNIATLSQDLVTEERDPATGQAVDR